MTKDMDLKDRRILYLLNENARMTSNKLGEYSGCSREVVEYRIKRLKSVGIVKEHIALVNTSKLGFDTYLMLIELQNYTTDTEKEIIEKLKQHPFTKWIIECSGNWDIQAAITAKDKRQLAKVIDEITVICGAHLRNYDLAYNVEFLKPENLSFIIPEGINYKIKSKPLKDHYQPDEKDFDIMKHLSTDAKKKIIDIAKETKLSVDTVKSRMKNLKERGVITKYQTVIDLSKLDYFVYYIFLKFSDLSEENEKTLKSFFETLPKVAYVERILGNWDVRIQLNCRSSLEYEEVLRKIREFFSTQLKYYNFSLMLKEHKRNSFPEGLWTI